MSKPKVAFFDFTCCEGCQIELTNFGDQAFLELLNHIEIVEFREGMTEKADHIDIAFIEGAIASPEHEEKLKDIRSRSTKLVAVGACAVTGVPASQRNTFTPEQKEAIQFLVDRFGALPEVKKVADVVTVDASVPGCPMNADMFLKAVNGLVAELRPELVAQTQ